MKVNFKLRNSTNKNEASPLYLEFSHLGKRSSIRIGNVNEENWDANRKKIKGKGKNLSDLQSKMLELEIRAHDIISECHAQRKILSAANLKKLVLDENSEDFIHLGLEWVKMRVANGELSYRTSVKYKSVFKKLKAYCWEINKSEKLPLMNFTKSIVKDYSKYMKEIRGNHTNTVTSNLKCLKAFTFHLMGEEKIKYNDNPFNGLKMNHEKPKRKNLNYQEIKKIQELKTNTNHLKKAKRLFLFLFESGLRINEALQIKINDVGEESLWHILSKQNKGNKAEKVELFYTKNIKEIINELIKEADDSQTFLFDYLRIEKHTSEAKLLSDLSSASARINKALKVISEKAKIDKPISTHYGRHSLATIALTNGQTYEDLKAILNHKQIRTTEQYAKPTDEAKKNAMKRMSEGRIYLDKQLSSV